MKREEEKRFGLDGGEVEEEEGEILRWGDKGKKEGIQKQNPK